MACPNGALPLELPIFNVTVSSDGRAVTYGIEFGVGTPQQILALQPAMLDQDLFVTNVAECNGTTNGTCLGQRGGVFDPDASASFNLVTRAQWNGSTDDDLLVNNYIFFNDHINYGSDGGNDNFPLFMNQPGILPDSGLPLGRNSTLLYQAHSASLIPSQAYGLYMGDGFMSELPESGLLVLGGYDMARIEGNMTDLIYDLDCPNCVDIEEISYDTDDISLSIFDTSREPLRVTLDSYQREIPLPQDLYDRFLTVTGMLHNTTRGRPSFPSDAQDPPTMGDLTVTLTNGFRTTIPAAALFTKHRAYSDAGSLMITDHETTLALTSNWSTDGADIAPLWGRPFLSQTYMIMDHAREEWSIGRARKGLGIEPSVVAICPPTDEEVSNSPGERGTSTAVIAGSVVGAVAFVALFIAGLWFWLLRRRRAGQFKSIAASDTETKQPPDYQQYFTPIELNADETSTVRGDNDPAEKHREMKNPEALHRSGTWLSYKKKFKEIQATIESHVPISSGTEKPKESQIDSARFLVELPTDSQPSTR